ncbi:MAG: hypothetical protein WAL75_18820 [Terracidiphilus sp.]
MSGFYLKGAFVQFMPTFLVPLPNVIMFQYNPETMTHTWKPSSPEVSPDSKTKPNPLAVEGLPGESFSFTLMMDSNDTIADGNAVIADLAKGTGLYSRLSALEMLLYPSGSFTSNQLQGKVSSAISSASTGSSTKAKPKVPQYVMSTVLFVWGTGRIVPVRVTNLTITEKLYDALLLNPIHAEATIEIQVLTPEELTKLNDSLRKVAVAAYDYSQAFRQAMALANLSYAASSAIGVLPFG